MAPDEWPQCVIQFTHWPSAEEVAADSLRPALDAAEADGELIQWSFLRKHPCWRLRYRPTDNRASQHLARVLDDLVSEGRVSEWTAGIYEPETAAFGGAASMEVAHALFHHDSRNILANPVRHQAAGPDPPGLGRRELAILLFSVLMRAAGLDLYEQGDVWAKVAALRSADDAVPPPERLKGVVHRLMTVDAGPTSRLVDGGPLAPLADWVTAFERAGQQMAELARRGRLERGLRAVLAHHVIFHWNRLGLAREHQSALSTLAKEVVMGTSDSAASAHGASIGSTSFGAVNTDMTEETSTPAERLRNRLADHLIEQGRIHTARVEEAVRAVPRHAFVPGVSLEDAYADQAVYTKHDGEVSISAASQPTVVALMLEQLQVEPGHKVLELGAGTGYNAGLLAYLVGESGHVTTIDVDDDIVDGAQSGLAAAGIENVTVILGDGALGYADGAPYDRIIATVGAHGVPEAWLEQLAPDGRLVVPLRLRGSVSRSITFEHRDGAWHSIGSEMNTFMPLRGIADDARRMVPLTSDGSVTLQTNREQAVDPAALAGVLDQPRAEAWTGVMFRGPESAEWMELWLTCTMPSGLSRMPAEKAAIDSGLVKAPYPSSTAVFEKGDLAYLTRRPAAERAADGAPLHEFGVIGHGPGGDELAGRVVKAIRTWDRDYRSRAVQFAIQPLDAEPIEQRPGRFSFDTAINRIVVEWQ